MTTSRKRPKTRKLLAATLGLATVTIGHGCSSGNLMPPPDTGVISRDAGADAGQDEHDGGADDDGGANDAGSSSP